ncbi:MAG: polysaccharide deacetylase family protein [Xanthobacteraceae bacterium]
MFDVTLTFDNGPDAAVTPAVLNALTRRNVHSTFFVVGEKLADPKLHSLAARAREEGHWIGNHTFSHAVPLGRQSGDVAEREIGRTEALIGALAHPDKLFRPYGGGGALDRGLLNASVVTYLTEGHYTCVLWNLIPGDWKDIDGWVDVAIEGCRARPWSLVVLHDLPTGAMAHLDRFLARVIDLGGRFRQEFPPECVPIVRGTVVLPIEPYVSDVA